MDVKREARRLVEKWQKSPHWGAHRPTEDGIRLGIQEGWRLCAEACAKVLEEAATRIRALKPPHNHNHGK